MSIEQIIENGYRIDVRVCKLGADVYRRSSLLIYYISVFFGRGGGGGDVVPEDDEDIYLFMNDLPLVYQFDLTRFATEIP